MNASTLLQHPSHEHGLVLREFSENLGISFKCHICCLCVEGPAYHCVNCRFFLHKLCAELLPEIQHPCHPQHPLILSHPRSRNPPTLYWSSVDLLRCCGCHFSISEYDTAPIYGCDGCELALHVGCAAATLPPPKDEHEQEEEKIQHFSHEHPLTSFHVNGPNQIDCRACDQKISGPIYGCRSCIFMLHEPCASLPQQILQHPYHPQHPLTLRADFEKFPECKACKRQSWFAYHCNECDYNLHAMVVTSCSMRHVLNYLVNWNTLSTHSICSFFFLNQWMDPFLAMPVLNKLRDITFTVRHRHEHNLTYFGKTGHLLCDLCYNDCSIDLYRCVPCNYNIHCSCTPLPPSVKHELHIHPMVLRDRVVDEFYDDQYCDLCETTRNPEHGVYYCDECRCAAHIDCVIPKVDLEQHKLAEDLMLRKLDEEIASVEAEMEAVKKKLKVLMTKLEGVKKKRNEIASSRMRGEAELDKA
ncbi:hypothetical protein CRG98_030451 [Punica granatum]|uniref:Phorbol-ester/DAG-type domain-containing protein n=1 Tax=Punica granatum TaxID=22663 RepID=A0A2I0IZJ9_PUNGR|nr:hypothetical protein CRG98_030451 [Punica granatum]